MKSGPETTQQSESVEQRNAMPASAVADSPEVKPDAPPASGMRTFLAIWGGHMVSVLGSALTNFGVGVWVYKTTGSATGFGFLMLAYGLPGVVLSPFAGVLVDRWNRRTALLVSEAGAGFSSLLLAIVVLVGHPQLWQIIGLIGLSSCFATLAWPAMSAAITQLVPKDSLSRANSLVLFNQAISEVLGPVIGGMMMAFGSLGTLVIADVSSFAISLGVLALIRVPSAPITDHHAAGEPMLKQAAYGWHYIRARPGLFGLLTVFTMINFLGGVLGVAATPLFLSFFRADVVGRISGMGGIGMICGTVIMAVWKGPKRKVFGVLGGIMLAGAILTGVAVPPNPVAYGLVLFLAMLCMPMINTSSQAIWQSKVAPDVQGRVFSIRRVIAQCAFPMAVLVAGPLADKVFGPAMMKEGSLAGTFGPLLGTGPGAGLRLMILALALGHVLAAGLVLLNPRVRHVESELPDFAA